MIYAAIISVLVLAVAVLGGYVAGLVRNPRRPHVDPPPPPPPVLPGVDPTDADDEIDLRLHDARPAGTDAAWLDAELADWEPK